MEKCELLPVRRKVRNDNSDETNCKYKEYSRHFSFEQYIFNLNLI